MQRVGMRAQIILQCFRFRRDRAEMKRSRVLRAFRDCAAKFVLGRVSETGQFRDPAGGARFLELRDRADLQLFVERLDLFRAETRERKELENVRRKFRAQVLEKFQRAGFDQLFYFRGDRFADAGNFFQRLFIAQVGDVAAPGFERSGPRWCKLES